MRGERVTLARTGDFSPLVKLKNQLRKQVDLLPGSVVYLINERLIAVGAAKLRR
jgi:hypothetical protein